MAAVETSNSRDDRPTVLIDALSARRGGGITDLLHLLPKLAERHPDLAFSVGLSSLYQQDLIDRMPAEMSVLDWRLPATPLVRRLAFRRFSIPKEVGRRQFDFLLTMSEMGSWTAPCKRIVFVRNPNPFASQRDLLLGSDRLSLALRKVVWRPILSRTFKGAHRLIFISETSLKDAKTAVQVPEEKSRVLYLGLDPAFLARTMDKKQLDGRPYVLAVSSFARHKNYEALIDGFALFIKAHPNSEIELRIAGSTANKAVVDRIQLLVKRNHLERRVRFLGTVPYEQLPALYQRASASVMPSLLETFGHPLLEAMASGVPLLASDLPICHEICGEGASFFNPRDPVDLARKLAVALDGGPGIDRQIEAGLRRVESFSWERAADGLIEILRSA